MAADDDAFYRPPDRGEGGAKTVDGAEKNPETALLPKSILGDQDLKEGAQITLRIVKDFGDEVEVARSEPEKQREPGAGGSQPPIPADDELAAMDTGE